MKYLLVLNEERYGSDLLWGHVVPREAVPNSLANWNHDCISWGVAVNWWFGIQIGVSRIVTIPFIRGSQQSKPPIYHWLIFRATTKNTFCMSKEFRGIYAKQVLRASIFPYFQKAVSKHCDPRSWNGEAFEDSRKRTITKRFSHHVSDIPIYQTITYSILVFSQHTVPLDSHRIGEIHFSASFKGVVSDSDPPLDATVCKSLPMSPISANVKLNIYGQ